MNSHKHKQENITLFVGGARSGKSALSLRYAESLGPRRLYVATAPPWAQADAETKLRIEAHCAQRGAGWHTWESPTLDFKQMPKAQLESVDVVLIDCLTFWLSNIMEKHAQVEDSDLAMRHCQEQLIDFLLQSPVPVVLVSNEVGQGIVPMSALGRSFRDWQGKVNQHMAQICSTVLLVSCGLPLALKGSVPVELATI